MTGARRLPGQRGEPPAGLTPVLAPGISVLVLGSFPSQKSLASGQYYAHPRNAFWPVMGALLGFAPGLPYEERLERLLGAGVGLWDVLGSCRRRGSADGAIERGSERANDIVGLLAGHPGLRALLLNGGKAEACLARHVPGLEGRGLIVRRLPSTSPAHARPLAEKMAAWREGLAAAGCALAP